MSKRIYEQVDVTAGAGVEVSEVIFTSTQEVPRTLKRICTNAATATVDLVVYDGREKIGDIPLDGIGLVESWVDFDRPIEVGSQVKVGLMNGTGGAITYPILVESEVPD